MLFFGMLIYPKLGFITQKIRTEKILLLCWFDLPGVPSVIETIEFIQRLSVFPVTVLNLFEHSIGHTNLTLPPEYDINVFSCVIFHNTVAYNPDNLFSLDSLLPTKFSEYDGVKILLKQDDHHRFKDVSDFINSAKIDALFTLIPPEEVHKVYSPSSLKVYHMLAGYVTPNMRSLNFSIDRPIDIGYRGSIMPLSFGKLCYEKRRIGDDVLKLLEHRKNLKLNISSRWEDRIGGEDWYKFLTNCKAVLGVESGSGVFDLDGTLAEKCKEIERELGPFRLDHEYATQYLNALESYEGNVKYFTISPRHFEAICNGAVQVLFPGKYSNKMIANKHYLELDREYKNLDEIVEKILDPNFREIIAQRAFEEVVLDESNSIENFISNLDIVINEQLELKGEKFNKKIFSCNAKNIKNILIIQASEYGSDPRRDFWMPRSPYDDLVFHKLVINKNIEELNVKILPQGGSLLEIPHKKVSADSFFEYATLIGLTNPLVSFLHQMIYSLSFNNRSFAEFYGASPKSKRLDEFRWYLNYLLQITNALLNGIKLESGFGALVAVNLPSLIAGAIAKHLHGIPLVYEALEYWPESDPDAEQFEIDFWIQLEKLLINYVDYANTVSKGLSKIMSATYGIDFHILPNAPPLTSTNGILKKRHTSKEINFIYQGSFARHRGLEQLIRAFGHKDVDANLKLRGHESKFKSELLSLSKDLGLLNKKVFFLPPVAPEELIDSAMNSGHVGVVPYMPHGKNYSNCSPNKLGQYFAASLPILANKTNFVEEQIVKSGAGIVVDFTKEDELIDAIKTFIDIEKLEKFSTASRAYHEKNFNWEIVSREFYKNISQLVRPSKNPLSSNFSISKQNNSKFIATQKKAYVEASPLTNFIYSLIFSRANLYFYRSLPEPLKKILSPLKRNLIYVYHHKLLKK